MLGYVVSTQGIRREDERIESVRACPEPQSICDIQVFLGFANFYRRFIKRFSRIAAPLTSMLKTSTPSAPARPGRTRVDENEADTDGGGGVGGGRINDGIANLSTSTKKMTGFLTFEASLAFTRLRKAFTEAHHLIISELTSETGLAGRPRSLTIRISTHPSEISPS